jgi:hypothetical protein
MEERLPEVSPPALDSWLRQQLGRRLVVIGLSLPAATPSGGEIMLDAPPADFIRELERFEEVWVRWLAAGTLVDQALTRAALHEGDVVLLWLADEPSDPRPAALAAFLEHAEAAGARDEAVTALVGPGASRELARRLGCNEGFAPTEAPGVVISQLAREVVTMDELRRRGSSPPCYL